MRCILGKRREPRVQARLQVRIAGIDASGRALLQIVPTRNISRQGALLAGIQGEVKIGEGGLDDVPFDEGAGGVEAAIEIKGGDDGFEGVGEEGGLAAATALFLAATETEERAEIDAGGDLAEVAAADEGGAKAGQFALTGG